MTANPFAALLDGVPRYRPEYPGVMVQTETGPGVWVSVREVLAALAAAYPADLAEAGKVVSECLQAVERSEGPYRHDWRDKPHKVVYALTRQITALLARIAAQEAVNKGLEAELRFHVDDAVKAWNAAEAAETALDAMTKGRDKAMERAKEQHACADSYAKRLAASEAKVAKLVEAGKDLQADMLERARIGTDATHGEEYRIVNAGRTAWDDFCAAITEASQ